MYILVLNCGSSSLKYQVFAEKNFAVVAKGLVDKIGMPDACIIHRRGDEKNIIAISLETHSAAIQNVLAILTTGKQSVIKSREEIVAVGHRVVHGGEYFSNAVRIDATVLEKIKICIPLAPLHNPVNVQGIEACAKLLPHAPQVAVFDTAFHQTIAKEKYLYPVPMQWYEKYKIRKYGFHGISHKYVSQRACTILGLPYTTTKIISCHIGNGASIAAIDGGKSVDTSMGFTPLSGLMMGTRTGDIDPAIIPFVMKQENLSPGAIEEILTKKSGVYGILDYSHDLRDVEDGFLQQKPQESLTMAMYIDRIVHYIGAYVAALNGTDVLVFTAGVLENSPVMRKLILAKLGWLGVRIDPLQNDRRGQEKIISNVDDPVSVIVVPTNEEYMIAQETRELLNNV